MLILLGVQLGISKKFIFASKSSAFFLVTPLSMVLNFIGSKKGMRTSNYITIAMNTICFVSLLTLNVLATKYNVSLYKHTFETIETSDKIKNGINDCIGENLTRDRGYMCSIFADGVLRFKDSEFV